MRRRYVLDDMRHIRTLGRILLGLFLVGAGVGHLTILREAFQAQVPPWLPLDKDFVVLASGVVEILLGVAVLRRAAPAVRPSGAHHRRLGGRGVLRRDLPREHLAAGHVGREGGAG